MPLVAFVVKVSFPAVPGHLLPRVLPKLTGKELQVVGADVTVVETVSFAAVFSEQAERAEDGLVPALGAAVLLQ